MRTLMIGALCLGALLSPALFAQRGGGRPGGGNPGGGAHPGGGRGMRPPQNAPVDTFGAFVRSRQGNKPLWGNWWGGVPYATYPSSYYDGPFDPSWYEQFSNQQPMMVAMPQPVEPPEPPPPPPPPARPEIREYSWPVDHGQTAQAFTIALKDGTVRFAVAVWVQDGVVRYRERYGGTGSERLDAVDRETTHRVNAEHGLNLSL